MVETRIDVIRLDSQSSGEWMVLLSAVNKELLESHSALHKNHTSYFHKSCSKTQPVDWVPVRERVTLRLLVAIVEASVAHVSYRGLL